MAVVVAEIVAIGSELLRGPNVDINGTFLALRLAEIGIDVRFRTVVGDDRGEILDSLTHALSRATVVVTSGGLGPTEDDLTREVLATLFKRPLQTDLPTLDRIRERASRRGFSLTEGARRMAEIPRGAELLPNREGSAPGILIEEAGRLLVALPGVPSELKPMVTEALIPRLAHLVPLGFEIRSRTLKACGPVESEVDRILGDLWESKNPVLGILVSPGEVHIRLTARGRPGEVGKLLHEVETEVRRRLGIDCFGADDERLEDVVGRLLSSRRGTVALAESCTGGLVGHRLTNVAGSSTYFEQGMVMYSNRAKVDILKVPEMLLERHGAVSAEVALAMARGARQMTGSDYGLAVTGIAGPAGGTPAKPVGLTYIGLADPRGEISREYRFLGGREENKWRASQMALDLLRRRLLEAGG